MNISSLIDTSEIIADAFKLPAMRINPRSSKRPNVDTALKCVVNQIQTAVQNHVSEDVQSFLGEAYETFCLIEGERPVMTMAKPEKVAEPTSQMVADYKRDFPIWQAEHAKWQDLADAWDDKVDELVEREIEPYKEHLSANWLGEYTIGTALHIENGVKIFADRLAKEYYKEITQAGYDEKQKKTPAQIMSSAGITTAQVDAALKLHLNPTEEDILAMSEKHSEELQEVAQKIADHIGKDFDTMTVYDDIDFASEDDDNLAYGAAARLGIDESDVEVLRTERLSSGGDIMDIVLKAIETINEGGKKKGGKKAAAAPKAPKEPKAPKAPAAPKAAPEENADAVEGDITVAVMQALKQTGAKDDYLAQGCGVSRATYNGYANGKVAFSPNEAQRSFIRAELVERANTLLEALGELDGAEATVVF